MNVPRPKLPRLAPSTWIAIAALLVAVTAPPAAFALGKVGTADLRNGAVTSAKIRDGYVRTPDLGRGAITSRTVKDDTIRSHDIVKSSRAARTIRYTYGTHDFDAQPLILQLPGTFTRSQVGNSDWSVRTTSGAYVDAWRLGTFGGCDGLCVDVYRLDDGRVLIRMTSSSSYRADDIRVFQTVPILTKPAKVSARQAPRDLRS